MNLQRGWTQWGSHGIRKKTSAANWAKPKAWQRASNKFLTENGHRRRVFCASLADVFDNKAPQGAREELFELIKATPDLDWQLLTKRPQNLNRFLPPDWSVENYPNVWLGITTEDQPAFDSRWPILAETPAAIRYLSFEPMIGGLKLDEATADRLAWVIWGGESGMVCRQAKASWARDITSQCKSLGVAIFGKQWGAYKSSPFVTEGGFTIAEAKALDPPSNGKGGGLLDGKLYREFPVSQAAHHHHRPPEASLQSDLLSDQTRL